MKKILKKFVACILICLTLFNLGTANVVLAADPFSSAIGIITSLIGGVVSIVLWPKKLIALGIVAAVQLLTSSIAAIGGVPSGEVILFVTPFHIFFNKFGITDINFFNISGHTGIMQSFREAIAMWYYITRLIATVGLLLILIYVGIRMALSTIAAEKAAYKSMLVNWAASLALLFILHYIMMFVIGLNSVIVEALRGIAEKQNISGFLDFIGQLMLVAASIGINSWAALILYGYIVIQTMTFLILYIKRMITVAFLVIIAPLITITYSLDKMGDQKSQVLDAWMKEFIFNILIQPFHCILYMIFVSVSVQLVAENALAGLTNFFNPNALGNCLLAILCLKFIKEGEDIVKKIFGFGKASSLGSVAASAMVTAAVVKNAGNIAQAGGKTLGKLKNTVGNSKIGKLISKSPIGKASAAVSKGLNSFAPTRALRDSVRNNFASSAGVVSAIMTSGAGGSIVEAATAGSMVNKGLDTYMKGSVASMVSDTNEIIRATDDGTETTNERTSRIVNNLEELTNKDKKKEKINKELEKLKQELKKCEKEFRAPIMGDQELQSMLGSLNQGIEHDLLKDPKEFGKNPKEHDEKLEERLEQELSKSEGYRALSDDKKEEVKASMKLGATSLIGHHSDEMIAQRYAMYEDWGGDSSKITDRLNGSEKDRNRSTNTPPEETPIEPSVDTSKKDIDDIAEICDNSGIPKDGIEKMKDLELPQEGIKKIKDMLENESDEDKLKEALQTLNNLFNHVSREKGLTGEIAREIMNGEIIEKISKDTTVEQIKEKLTVLEKVDDLVEGRTQTYDFDEGDSSSDVQMLEAALKSLTNENSTSVYHHDKSAQYNNAVRNVENAIKTACNTGKGDKENEE